MRSFEQALQQEARFARYEAIVDRRNAALRRCDWCDMCIEWVESKAWKQHAQTEPHLKAERRYLAERE